VYWSECAKCQLYAIGNIDISDYNEYGKTVRPGIVTCRCGKYVYQLP